MSDNHRHTQTEQDVSSYVSFSAIIVGAIEDINQLVLTAWRSQTTL
jgi:hypothetical protein